MLPSLNKCPKCGEYTLKEICDKCQVNTKKIKNYKFMINLNYIKYRLKEKGYIRE